MSANSSVTGLLDTNILLYAHLEEETEHYHESARLLELARTGEEHFAVTPQVLWEFYSVITNPRRTSQPYSADIALAAMDRLLSYPGIAVLPYPFDLTDRVRGLLARQPVTGGNIYDLQIVASMLGNGVSTIFTYNRQDFEPFPEIRVETPSGSNH